MRRCSMDGDRRSLLADIAGLSRSGTEASGESEVPYFLKLDQTPIKHRYYEAVRRSIAALHLRHLEGHGGDGLFVTGQSGSGKSFLVKTYAAMFPATDDPAGRCMPVLTAEAPSRPTVATMVAQLLKAIGVPKARRGSKEWDETERLLGLIEELGVEIIILDEVNNFHDHAGESVLSEFTDWVKFIRNSTDLPIVLVGLPRSESTILKNMQLRRRFSGGVTLAPFTRDSGVSWREFRAVLQTLHRRTPLEAVQYSNQLLARRFYYASAGLMDYPYKIINKAIAIAHPVGAAITVDTLAAAFVAGVWKDCPEDINPFLTAPKKLRLLTQPGEPFAGWDHT
jgi:type II secretory pathway predicted ATPase ExeA